MSDLRRVFLANTLYGSLGLYTDYAAALIISVIIARHLGPEQYGTYTLLIWISSVGVVVSNNGITTGVMKFVGEARGKGAPEQAGSVLLYLERLQLLSSIATCAVFGVIIALAERIVVDTRAQQLLWILLPAVALRSLYVYYISAAKGFENFRLAAQVHAFVAPLSLVIVLVVGQRGGTLKDFVYAYALICLLYAWSMRFALFRRFRRPETTIRNEALVSRIHRHVLYASAIVALELLVLRQTELLFLDRFSTQENIAYYGLGRSLSASAMLLIPGVVTALLLPVMSRTFGEDPSLLGRRFLAATRYILILAVPVVTLCEVFAADVITILYGKDYGPAVLVFRVAVATSAVGVISSSASSYQLGTDRQPVIVRIMAMVTALTLILDYVLIRAYELKGAIAAGAFGSVLLGAGLLWHAYNTLHVKFDFYTYVRVIAAGALCAVPAVIAQKTLPFWIALPVGGFLLTATYCALTVLLGGWTREDLRSMRALTNKIPRWLGKPIGAFLRGAEEAMTLAPKEPIGQDAERRP